MEQTELFTLHNDEITVQISRKGAELQSVIAEGVERIWCGDPAVWNRRAPLLFPFIGRLKDGWYEWEGKRINAPMHGFCRDRLFEVNQLSPTCIRFTTCADDATRAVYPFDFRLTVEYELHGPTVIKKHIVENLGTAPMPFELGGHEAYATRLLPGEHMSDYYLRFFPDAHLNMYAMDADGILGLPMTPMPLTEGRLEHIPEQLGLDTIVTLNVPERRVSLESHTNDFKLTVYFPDFPYLGIWTMDGQDDARYLCIEPWSALPDTHFSSRELGARPGVRTLAPYEHTELSYGMAFW